MKVKLLKGIKYNKQPYKAGEEIEVELKDIAEMIAKGVVSEDTEVPVEDKTPAETDINKMKVDELKEYAEKNGIDLGEATKKEEILNVIKEAEAVANANTTS
ncbi:hypothetical protein M3629_03815 [Paenibacillus polysaccharolyticus]|uniref:DUF7210 family protein n=1 Tax=Paenibacillus polysaccharolyticus TaxID=582692 RepID=UPI00203FD695|nr:hypothetical protein [Paenibacillus polysaccharolyticus]MCM3131895.1 hypothetical protein [Paenibacillus polysaccharolyticus]